MIKEVGHTSWSHLLLINKTYCKLFQYRDTLWWVFFVNFIWVYKSCAFTLLYMYSIHVHLFACFIMNYILSCIYTRLTKIFKYGEGWRDMLQKKEDKGTWYRHQSDYTNISPITLVHTETWDHKGLDSFEIYCHLCNITWNHGKLVSQC